MTAPELIAALGPGRLPAGWDRLGGADLAALAAVELALAAVIAVALRPLLARRVPLAARLRATRGLPPQERILAVARLLGRLPHPLRDAAYGAAPPPDDAAIERAARRRR